MSKFPINSKDYELVEQIGFGTGDKTKVWRARVIKTNEEVAIKIIELEEFGVSQFDTIAKEIQMMNMCQHPNIVEYHCSFVSDSSLWLVMELLEGSCLDIVRHAHPHGISDEKLITSLLWGVLQALQYLHASHPPRIHRDVKAGNILIASSGRVRLADLGISTALESRDQRKTTFAGTPCWMAPEVLDSERWSGYDTRADVWSLGITALELACGAPPYSRDPPLKVIVNVLSHPSPTIKSTRSALNHTSSSSSFSSHFEDFISSCLTKDPSKRPTTTNLLKHKLFDSLVKNSEDYIRDRLLAKLPKLGERFRQQQKASKTYLSQKIQYEAEKFKSSLTSNNNNNNNNKIDNIRSSITEEQQKVDSGEWDFEIDETSGEKRIVPKGHVKAKSMSVVPSSIFLSSSKIN